jgi:hypothetical protein
LPLVWKRSYENSSITYRLMARKERRPMDNPRMLIRLKALFRIIDRKTIFT